MKKVMKKQTTLLTIVFVMVFTLILNVIPAYAATTKLSTTKATIAINGTKTIKLKNKNKKAEYTYSSNNKKIATVNKKGVITGVSAGTTTVKVVQILNSKKTTLGTVNVTVKNASINKEMIKEIEESYILTSQVGAYPNYMEYGFFAEECVKYLNPKAEYKFYSCDTKKMKIATDGMIEETKGTGTVKVEIKEVYNKKTKSLGTFKVKIENPSLTTKKATVPMGETVYSYEYIKNVYKHQIIVSDSKKQPKEAEFNSVTKNNKSTIFEVESENWDETTLSGIYMALKAKKAGTAYIHYAAYDSAKKSYNNYMGCVAVTVEDVSKVSDLVFPWEKGDYSGYSKKDGLKINGAGDEEYIYLTQVPEKYLGEYTVKSSNSKVVEASIEEKIGTYYEGELLLTLDAKKVGTATITIKANGLEKSFKVTVNPEETE